ncbi:anthranilate synthase component I family protein [Halobaculum sp. MBLA0143]|uniref:anthranilate synthase component I family protein n=1 Tax=Halobaculum sp. MBLA0143 TaxID=3079933 RepID=UPI003523B8F8
MRLTTDRETYRRLAADGPPSARVPVVGRLQVADPFDAYRRARGDDWSVFLETSGVQSGWGYFGVTPTDRLTVRAPAAPRSREPDGHGQYADPSPTLAALSGFLDAGELRRGECPVPYPGGTVGWLSYDVARELETLPGGTPDDRGLPRLQAARYDALAAWECPAGDDEPLYDDSVDLWLCASPPVGDDPDAGYDRAVAAVRSLADRIQTGDPGVGAPPAAADRVRFESGVGREAYADRVRAVREYVRAGDTFQANVSHRLTAPAAVHPVDAFAALRRVNPAPYSGLAEFGGVDLVGASPELLLRREPVDDDTVAVDGESFSATARLVTEPIAGTRPRGETTDADAALETDLLNDEKERAEHAMLVDLERNDLGKVSVPGSVAVPEYRRVDRYSEVMHLVSLVEGAERPDRSLADGVAAVFPGGTITGAPKPRTMDIIDELETTRRGPYTGSLGLFGFDGRATLNIQIRTLVRTGEQYALRVGAGIVHDSEPEREYDETLAKARGLVSALDDRLDAAALDIVGPNETGTSAGDETDEPNVSTGDEMDEPNVSAGDETDELDAPAGDGGEGS